MANESSDALIARFLALHPKAIDLSLGRMRDLLEKLGRPQDRLPPVIHVAGTNGKGSTIAFMRAMLEADGAAVHVYTSPHLVRFHERIRLGRPEGGRYVDEERLVDAFRECERVNNGAPITVFEITTAAGLLLFAQEPADVLLLEVGLGGRFDATNVVDQPAATVITPVSMDHAEYLGDTVLKIAAEKAGILKRASPAILAIQDPEPMAVLETVAERVGAGPVLVGGQDFTVREEAGRLVYEDARRLLDLPLPRLSGRHQHVNAATAIAALGAAGWSRLPTSAIERGLTQADWPGRLQRLSRGRLPTLIPDGVELWLDGGHNPDGGRVLSAAMAEREEEASAPLVMIVGMLGTKDAGGFLRHFLGLARWVIAVPINTQMAARPAEEVASIARDVGLPADAAPSIEAALAMVGERSYERPPRILITGSLYLAGDVLLQNDTLPT